ncbi:AAA family ATPase [Methylibium petroleiphilum]|uniref:AAA family ATPase n=1 Tax=Methylibium petroleiphilum TaxID=105560 RepID=UPI003D2E1382
MSRSDLQQRAEQQVDEAIELRGGAAAVVADSTLQAVRGSAFVRAFEAPDPIIEAVPATGRGRLIAITGQTGHGKTTVSALMQVHVVTGTAFAGNDVARGRVLVLCGENPDDYNLHLIATMQDMGLEPADLDDILVVPSRFPIDQAFDDLRYIVDGFGDLVAVFVDTSAAFFFGNDDNGNVDQYEHASKLRSLTTLPGRPLVFVLCHPTKSASKENLVPRGGGSFLNEIDANLTVWKDDAGIVSLHWAGKMRGPNFDPIRFELKGVELRDYPDAKGRPTRSVAARYVPDERAEQLQARQLDDEDRLLIAMKKKPEATVRELAMQCGWTSGMGVPNPARVDRRMRALLESGLVEQDRKRRWQLTAKGRKEVEKLP